MITNGVESERLSSFERLTLAAHLLAALSTALAPVATALRLSKEGRLHEARIRGQELQQDVPGNGRGSAKDYFNT